MYSISALWTAAHHKIPMTYVMLNNAAYRILSMVEYLGKAARGRRFARRSPTTGPRWWTLCWRARCRSRDGNESRLDSRHRPVRMGRVLNEPAPVAVDEQVELLEHGLPDQDFVADHQGLVEGVAPFELDHERLRNTHGLGAAISVPDDSLPAEAEPKITGNRGRHHRADRAGVSDGIDLDTRHLFRSACAATDKRFVHRVRQPSSDSHLAHAHDACSPAFNDSMSNS